MWPFSSKPKPLSISGPIGSDRLAFESGTRSKMKRVVFAGHGSFNSRTDRHYPKVRLPPSVTMVFWCRHGEGLSDTIAEYVEANEDINRLPDWLMERVRQRGRSTRIPEVVKGGSEIWNYRLEYPSGLYLGRKPDEIRSSAYNLPTVFKKKAHFPKGVVGDRRFVVVPPLRGDRPRDFGVPVIALLAAYWNVCDGAVVHWCACRRVYNE